MVNEEFKSYKPVHTQQELIDLTQSVMGAKVKTIGRQDLGEINAVYFVDLDNGEQCVVRVSPKERDFNTFETEAWAFKKSKGVGVPTPEVLVVDTTLSRFPEAFMITKRIDGLGGDKSWSEESEEVSLIRQLGHYLSLIHSIKAHGFERHPHVKEGELVGKYSSQWESLSADLNQSWWGDIIVREGLLSQEKVDKYKKMLENNSGIFDLPNASLVHGDPSIKNSIVKDGKIVGILDMENCIAGDPIQDFAWYHFWTEGAEPYFTALKDGYDNKALFDDKFMKKLYLYQLYLGQSVLGYYHTRNNQDGIVFVQRRLPIIESELEKIK